MLPCPKRCWTIFGCTPRERSKVAQVWRRSCQRISGNSARRSRGLKYLFTMFCASRGVPFEEANTRPFSCHFPPALSCSSSCLLRWLLRASTALWGKSMVRASRGVLGFAEDEPATLPYLRGPCACGRVARYQMQLDGLLQGAVQHGVNVSHARRFETVFELRGIESLDVRGVELGEFHHAEGGGDVLPDLQLEVVVGARCE